MAGTRAGGLKARETNMQLHGQDFYSRIGSKGGSWCGKKGFVVMPTEKAREAGAKGGRISRRGPAKKATI